MDKYVGIPEIHDWIVCKNRKKKQEIKSKMQCNLTNPLYSFSVDTSTYE